MKQKGKLSVNAVYSKVYYQLKQKGISYNRRTVMELIRVYGNVINALILLGDEVPVSAKIRLKMAPGRRSKVDVVTTEGYRREVKRASKNVFVKVNNLYLKKGDDLVSGVS